MQDRIGTFDIEHLQARADAAGSYKLKVVRLKASTGGCRERTGLSVESITDMLRDVDVLFLEGGRTIKRFPGVETMEGEGIPGVLVWRSGRTDVPDLFRFVISAATGKPVEVIDGSKGISAWAKRKLQSILRKK